MWQEKSEREEREEWRRGREGGGEEGKEEERKRRRRRREGGERESFTSHDDMTNDTIIEAKDKDKWGSVNRHCCGI